MRRRLLVLLAVFMAFFGAWSLGGDIVDWWNGQLSPWFLVRLIAAGIFTLFMISFLKDG